MNKSIEETEKPTGEAPLGDLDAFPDRRWLIYVFKQNGTSLEDIIRSVLPH